ncbi:hypothetical protein [uncultured Duncaniella sp.]|uniref:hypothetical protein n=1 Tax=uncultured Duncaniella sp. TaxID=2768039 RepID=UPI00260CFE55|nr:hypothetical protein [uncultured Duncaniella sp.]
METIPKAVEIIPEAVKTIPKAVEIIPEVVKTIPKVVKTIPKAVENSSISSGVHSEVGPVKGGGCGSDWDLMEI